jgi:hypothetical protein
MTAAGVTKRTVRSPPPSTAVGERHALNWESAEQKPFCALVSCLYFLRTPLQMNHLCHKGEIHLVCYKLSLSTLVITAPSVGMSQEPSSCLLPLSKYVVSDVNLPVLCSRTLFQKLVCHLLKNFPSIYGTRKPFTKFIRGRHLFLSRAKWIQSTSIHSMLLSI